MSMRFSVISNSATYQLTRSVAAVDEGNQVTITLNTSGVQNGQKLPYTVSGPNITTSDFVGLASLSGEFAINNNTSTLILTTNADLTQEGAETFSVTLENGTGISVDINDTSAAALALEPKWVSAIPVLTSNNQNGYVVSYSSLWGGWSGFSAFNGVLTSSGWMAGDGTLPQWLKIKLPTAQVFTKAGIVEGALTVRSDYSVPAAFQIQGSNDDVNWTTLKSVSGITSIAEYAYTQTSTKTPTVYFTNNTTSYLYYRIYITQKLNTYAGVMVTDLLFA